MANCIGSTWILQGDPWLTILGFVVLYLCRAFLESCQEFPKCSSWGRKLKECWELLRLDLFGSSSGASLCPWHPVARFAHLSWSRMDWYLRLFLGYPHFFKTRMRVKCQEWCNPALLEKKCFENINFSNKHLFVFFRGCSYSLPPRSLSGLIWCSFRISETNKNPLTTSDPVVKKCSFFTVLSLVLPDEKNLVLCLSSFATGFQVPIGQLRPEIQPSWARKM